MPKLVWRLKLVAELRPGVMTEAEVARIERDDQAGLAHLGLRLAETKQLTAALQAEIVPAQVAVLGERCRCCSSCGRLLASKGYYPVTFRSLFGDVPVRVRRLLACSCPKLDFGHFPQTVGRRRQIVTSWEPRPRFSISAMLNSVESYVIESNVMS